MQLKLTEWLKFIYSRNEKINKYIYCQNAFIHLVQNDLHYEYIAVHDMLLLFINCDSTISFNHMTQ